MGGEAFWFSKTFLRGVAVFYREKLHMGGLTKIVCEGGGGGGGGFNFKKLNFILALSFSHLVRLYSCTILICLYYYTGALSFQNLNMAEVQFMYRIFFPIF